MERLRYARDAVARSREKHESLSIRSQVAGTFVAPDARNLPDRFVRQGDELATVVELDRILLRAIVTQDDIDLVRDRLVDVKVRLSEDVGEVLRARLRRTVPAASHRLPSAALASSGGGEAVLDPRDPSGDRTLASYFELELELPSKLHLVNVGGRAFLRFDLGSEPLAFQAARRLHQLFLAKLDV
jgi:putative peptide zinc metalloprotease protein